MENPLLSYVRTEEALQRKLGQVAPSRAIDTFPSKYGNVGTKIVYLGELSLYLDWLKRNASR